MKLARDPEVKKEQRTLQAEEKKIAFIR